MTESAQWGQFSENAKSANFALNMLASFRNLISFHYQCNPYMYKYKSNNFAHLFSLIFLSGYLSLPRAGARCMGLFCCTLISSCENIVLQPEMSGKDTPDICTFVNKKVVTYRFGNDVIHFLLQRTFRDKLKTC